MNLGPALVPIRRSGYRKSIISSSTGGSRAANAGREEQDRKGTQGRRGAPHGEGQVLGQDREAEERGAEEEVGRHHGLTVIRCSPGSVLTPDSDLTKFGASS